MSILIDRNTPVIVQGITGKMARFHTTDMVNYGHGTGGSRVSGLGGAALIGAAEKIIEKGRKKIRKQTL